MGEKQRVLIVDDEPRNQRIISEILEDLVELKIANNGEEALAVVESYQPDLVLLDIMMPGIDGYEVCTQIRKNHKLASVKIILVSGKAMTEERLKGYEIGADDYMTKPFISEELLAKAKVFLRLNAIEKELHGVNKDLEIKVGERTKQLVDAESKLITAAKMAALGEMAGGVAHEINTPLGTISMIADEIKEAAAESPPNTGQIVEMTDVITETIKRIGSIIQGLRTFSRDGSRDKLDEVPLKQIIDDTLLLCREKAKNTNVILNISPIEAGLKVRCRPVQISQVLLNLINNACDAISQSEAKWIKIEAGLKDSGVEISVCDSGLRISDEIQEKMFQPFFTTKAIGKGVGLGLSVSKGIVEAHQGTLLVDNTCANTRFVLNFPAENIKADLVRKSG